jgi:hypothetical protein
MLVTPQIGPSDGSQLKVARSLTVAGPVHNGSPGYADAYAHIGIGGAGTEFVTDGFATRCSPVSVLDIVV